MSSMMHVPHDYYARRAHYLDREPCPHLTGPIDRGDLLPGKAKPIGAPGVGLVLHLT
jgi:hypothetical protein